MLLLGDSLSILPTLPENSVDSIVTDPPYHLTQVSRNGSHDPNETHSGSKGFMGLAWDGGDIAYNVDLWKAALKVLKPGGYLLSFGGTRTYHRMACAIEDAGFIIHPLIAYINAQGFPKATNLSKRFDAEAGAEREVVGSKHVTKDLARRGRKGDMHVIGEASPTDIPITAPATPEAKQWDGYFYGLQSLKPAIEPICMAQKPISEKRMTDNIRKWGTGAINIDATRIPYEPDCRLLKGGSYGGNRKGAQGHSIFGTGDSEVSYEGELPKGRWPANCLFSEDAAALLDLQSGTSHSSNKPSPRPARTGATNGKTHGGVDGGYNYKAEGEMQAYDDSGGASRYFQVIKDDLIPFIYMPKASKKERGEGNDHPTVKSLELMKILVRLITPPGGTVLDPFAGSGTTGVACQLEGFDFVLCEKDLHSFAIAKNRLGLTQTT